MFFFNQPSITSSLLITTHSTDVYCLNLKKLDLPIKQPVLNPTANYLNLALEVIFTKLCRPVLIGRIV
jgi:hypothetical protein